MKNSSDEQLKNCKNSSEEFFTFKACKVCPKGLAPANGRGMENHLEQFAQEAFQNTEIGFAYLYVKTFL